MKKIELNKLETLSQKIADYCTEQDLPKWYTVDEILELHQVRNHHITLTDNQKEQLYKFKEQLEEL